MLHNTCCPRLCREAPVKRESNKVQYAPKPEAPPAISFYHSVRADAKAIKMVCACSVVSWPPILIRLTDDPHVFALPAAGLVNVLSYPHRWPFSHSHASCAKLIMNGLPSTRIKVQITNMFDSCMLSKMAKAIGQAAGCTMPDLGTTGLRRKTECGRELTWQRKVLWSLSGSFGSWDV
jgi:hypothetical protein